MGTIGTAGTGDDNHDEREDRAYRPAIHRRDPYAEPFSNGGDPRTFYAAMCGAVTVHTATPDWSLQFCRYCWPGNLPAGGTP